MEKFDIPPGYHSLEICHQCGGTGKDSKAENSASCCSCYGLGKIYTKVTKEGSIIPVDYITQREIVQKMREKTNPLPASGDRDNNSNHEVK